MAKIGEGHGSAFMRQGLRELRAAMYPDSNVAQQPEYGLYGTKTPGEVAEDRRGGDRDPDEEKPAEKESVLSERMRAAQSREAQEDREIEHER